MIHRPTFHDTEHGLSVEERALDDLADEFGTPLYVYSAAAIRRSVAALRDALPAAVELFFSLKANPNPAIVALLQGLGVGAEVASLGELDIARRAGVQPRHILFAGPGKTDAELSAAVEAGIANVNVESVAEARRLDAIAASQGKVATCCLRINPIEINQSARIVMGGQPLPFGVDEEIAGAALREIATLTHLRLIGVHVFSGTQVLVAKDAAENFTTAVKLGSLFQEALGRAPEVIDIGPGLGVPIFVGEEALDLAAFRVLAAQALAGAPASTRIAVEAGRFLVADAGAYVATVLDVKVSRGTSFIVLDGGMHHHAAATGGFGNVFRKGFPIRATRPSAEAPMKATLVGPCCTPMDQLARDLSLAPPSPGNRIAVLCSGAYGYSVSPLLFLSHATPAEVLVDGNDARVIRSSHATAALFVD